MKKVSFLKKITPTVVEVAGVSVSLLFTMGAAAALEDAFGQHYLQVVCDMLQVPVSNAEPTPPPLSVEQQAVIVSILAQEAGQDLPVAELCKLHMRDFSALARAAQDEIIAKMPWTEGSGAAKKA